MRSEGFPFIVWGSGGWTRVRFVCCVPARSSRVASRHRESRRVASRCVVNSVPCGSASRARRVCGVGGAVPWGLLLGRSCGWRCAMGFAAGQVAWVALCHADCCWARRVGGAVPWGLLLGVSRRWRCAMGIAAGRVALVALCHGDCCWACRVGGAVPWGCCWACRGRGAVPSRLLVGVSRGWRRVLGIADQGLVAVLVRVAAGVLASQNGPF